MVWTVDRLPFCFSPSTHWRKRLFALEMQRQAVPRFICACLERSLGSLGEPIFQLTPLEMSCQRRVRSPNAAAGLAQSYQHGNGKHRVLDIRRKLKSQMHLLELSLMNVSFCSLGLGQDRQQLML